MGETISQEVKLIVHKSENELDQQTQHLFQKAREAAQKAYAKYSNFQVGAALLLEDGQIITGNNQENAVYPSGLCAERVAFFSAKSQNPESAIDKVVIVAKRTADDYFILATPCGSCRQVMSEYEGNQKNKIKLYLCDQKGKIFESESIENLLPFRFSEKMLNKD
jgi:cytidine deaminase